MLLLLFVFPTCKFFNSSHWDPFPSDLISGLRTEKKDFDLLIALLESLPPLEVMQRSEDIRKCLDWENPKEGKLYKLLRFIVASNRSHLVRLKPSEQITEMNTSYQFKLLSNPPEVRCQKQPSFLLFSINQRLTERGKVSSS